MSKNTITLDNFAEWDDMVDGVAMVSRIPLEPYVPSSDIHVDLRRVARAARLGHLAGIAFVNHAERDSTSAGIDSVNEDGSATAIFSSSVSRAPRVRADSFTPGDPLITRGFGLVSINLSHHELDEINLREAKPWAKHIDLSVKEGLRNSSENKLLGRRVMRAAFFSLNAGIVSLIATSYGVTPENMAEAYGLSVIGYNGIRKALDGEVEATMIPFLPYDRFGLVQAYTRSRKFVEAK